MALFDGSARDAREAANVPSHSPPTPYGELPRPFWLTSLLGALVTAVLAYFIAFFIFGAIGRVCDSLHGPLWAAEFRGPLFAVLLVMAVVLAGIPYFMKELDPTVRTLSLFCLTFLVAYAVFKASGAFNPDVPMQLLVHYVVVPVRAKVGF